MASEIGIIVASYEGHRSILPETLKPFVEHGKHSLVLCYDDSEFGVKLPFRVEILLADRQYGWQVGERTNIHRGVEWAKRKDCEYVFKLCGDVLIERPEGIEALPAELGNVQIIGCEWGNPRYDLGPQVLFAKTDSLFAVCEYWKDDLESMRHIERMYGEAAKELGIRWENKNCKWWERTVGRVHMHEGKRGD